MEPEGARSLMHRRLMAMIARGARAQEDSRLLVEAHADLDADVRATIAAIRTRRAQLRATRESAGRSQSDS